MIHKSITDYTKEELRTTGIYMWYYEHKLACYIGSTDKSFLERTNRHLYLLREGKHHSPYFQNVYNKYGKDALKFMILEFTIPGEKGKKNKHLISREQFWMGFYGATYNMCKIAASTKGVKASKETRTKISVSRLGKTHSEETRKKLSIANTGEKHPQYGKRGKDSHNYGKAFSEVHRNKLSLAFSGEKNSQYGKVGELSPTAKSYTAVSPDGISYIFKGLNAFCRKHNLRQPTMTKVAQGKFKHHKGWTCSYYEEPVPA